MASYVDYSTSIGLNIPDISQVVADVQAEWQSVFGSNLNLNAETPQGRIIEAIAQARWLNLMLIATNAQQLDYKQARGVNLDALASLFFLQRIQPTRTFCICTVTGTSQVTIPKGSQARSTDGQLYQARNAITIGLSGIGSGIFENTAAGAIGINALTLTQIVSNVGGWETITNDGLITIGKDLESDFELYSRIRDTRYWGISYVEAIRSQLMRLEEVHSCFVYDNPNGEDMWFDGTQLNDTQVNPTDIEMPAHSMLAVVDGGTNADVALAIYKSKSGGCAYTSISSQSVTVDVQDPSFGTVNSVTFNRPSYFNVWVNVSVRTNTYVGSNLTLDVVNAILQWVTSGTENVDRPKLGVNISAFEISAALSEIIPEVFIASVQLSIDGTTFSANEITQTYSTLGQFDASRITVTIL